MLIDINFTQIGGCSKAAQLPAFLTYTHCSHTESLKPLLHT
jgi:hypothetical protein